MTVTIRTIYGPEAAGPEVSKVWDDLMAADPVHPSVSSRGFAEFAETVFPTRGDDVVVIAEDGGRPIGLWPLRVTISRLNRLTLPVLVHRCGRKAYYGDGVFLPGAPVDEIYRKGLARLTENSVGDAVDIWRMLRATPELASSGTTAVNANIVDLTGSLPRHSDRRLRRLQRLNDFRIETVSDSDSLASVAAEFAALHSRLKRFQNQFAYFEMSPGAAERFPPALSTLAKEIPVSVLTFRMGSRLIAAQVLMHHGNNTTLWWVAWEPELAELSPGIAILDRAVAMCRERGDTTFHLGPGGESYKLRWASPEVTVGRIRQFRNTPRGLAARFDDRAQRLLAATRERWGRSRSPK